MTNAPSPQKTSGLAIFSFILGLFSLLCCGIFTGIAAIICGHLAHGKIRRSNGLLSGEGLAMTGFIMGYLSLLTTIVHIALAVPAIVSLRDRVAMTSDLNNARQIHLAVTQMSLDGTATDNTTLGFPFDVGITTVTQLKSLLVENNYLTAEEADALGFEKFLIGNISESDPPSTVFIRSRPDDAPGPTIIFLMSGDGTVHKPSKTSTGVDPPREPTWLAP